MRWRLIVALQLLVATGLGQDARPADAVIVGAGVSGLSAALEGARAGANITVVEMSTVGGGHAIMSNGAVCLVDTPLQRRSEIEDSHELAKHDFLTRGEDADEGWVERYVRDSKTWLFDWLADLGVEFQFVVKPAGNSVARLHLTRGKGLGLAGPLFRECLRHPNITFVWATKAEELVMEDGAVTGLKVRDLRHDSTRVLEAKKVIVATGGFASNLELVRQHWPEHLPSPPRLLVGASHFATASGHAMVTQAGGSLERMDHQWNYVMGLPETQPVSGGWPHSISNPFGSTRAESGSCKSLGTRRSF